MIGARETTIEVVTKAEHNSRDLTEAERTCVMAAHKIPMCIKVNSKGYDHYDQERDKYVFVMSIIRV